MIPDNQKEYLNLIDDLKQKIRQARQTASIAVNVEMLLLYWEIGKSITEQEATAGWGKKIVDNLERDLKVEFPDTKGFSARNLRYMRAFYLAHPHFIILQSPPAKQDNTLNQPNPILQQPVAQLEGRRR